MRMVVVLPQPGGPRRVKNSPSAMSSVTPLTAWTTSPCETYSLTTSTSSIALPIGLCSAIQGGPFLYALTGIFRLFAEVVHDVLDPGDRKSTRLNSSHVKI